MIKKNIHKCYLVISGKWQSSLSDSFTILYWGSQFSMKPEEWEIGLFPHVDYEHSNSLYLNSRSKETWKPCRYSKVTWIRKSNILLLIFKLSLYFYYFSYYANSALGGGRSRKQEKHRNSSCCYLMGLISNGNIQKEITTLISGMNRAVRCMILWKEKAHVSTKPRQEERVGALEVTALAEIHHGSIACQELLPRHPAQNATPAKCLCYWDILSRCLRGGCLITPYVQERCRRYLHYCLHLQRQFEGLKMNIFWRQT